MPREAPRQSSSAGFLGLALLGWGLAILVGFVPHEDLLVGAGLAVLGACLTIAVGVPPVPRVPAWLLATLGGTIVLAIAAYVVAGHTLDGAKLAFVGLGVLLMSLAAVADETIALPRGRSTTGRALAVHAMACVGGPGVVYVVQALFAQASGTTPIEAFLRWGLLAPLAAVVGLFGWRPTLDGQILQYDGVAGPLRVEVGAACSGIQAMALFAVVLGMFLVAQRPRGGWLAAWIAIGLGGIYVANLLRLVAITAVGHWYGAEALQTAHAQAGWMFFVAWALAFAALARKHGTPAQA